MGKMVGIAEFKAKCERLISQMEIDGEPIELTRRGKVVGVLGPPLPIAAAPKPDIFGALKGTVRIVGDLDEPLDPDWEAEWGRNWDELGYPVRDVSK